MMSGPAYLPSSEMNVTPLIDVLLVLLIIFMVITPLTPSGLDALIPQPPQHSPAPPPVQTVVIQVLSSEGAQVAALMINEEHTTWDALPARLRSIFAERAEKVVFIQGDRNVTFDSIAQVIDLAHGAGIDKVGLMPAAD